MPAVPSACQRLALKLLLAAHLPGASLLAPTRLVAADRPLTTARAVRQLPLVEAQIMLPKGGSFAPDAMRQLMGIVMQLDPGADQLIKALNCK